MPDNRDSMMHIIDIGTGSAPSGWTKPAGTSKIACKRVLRSEIYKLRQTGYEVVQKVVFKYNDSGSTPFSDSFDGNDCYSNSNTEAGSAHMTLAKCNESGNSDAKVYDYTEGNTNPAIEDWGDKLRQVPLTGVVKPDSNPTSGMLSDANSVDTDDVPLT